MRFVIPMPPNRANARGHWRKHHRDKLEYWASLDSIAAYGMSATHGGGWMIPKPPKKPLARANVYATLYVWAKMDEGNAINRMKWAEDWMVQRGYIVDDKSTVLNWGGIPIQKVDRNAPRAELTLEAA